MTDVFAVRWVILDVEGTISPTELVRCELYGYAYSRFESFLAEHVGDPLVEQAMRETRELGGLSPTAPIEELANALRGWQASDMKVAPLKLVQGLIWQHGYASGDLVGAVFPDVPPALRRWRQAGLRLAIFSSGSVTAQRSLLRYCAVGDLSPLIERHFDIINSGPKQAIESYRIIAAELGCVASSLLFLTDMPAELDAAVAAGWQGVGVSRNGEPFAAADFGRHRQIDSFDSLELVMR